MTFFENKFNLPNVWTSKSSVLECDFSSQYRQHWYLIDLHVKAAPMGSWGLRGLGRHGGFQSIQWKATAKTIVNSLYTGKYDINLKKKIFDHTLRIRFMGAFCEIAFRRMRYMASLGPISSAKTWIKTHRNWIKTQLLNSLSPGRYGCDIKCATIWLKSSIDILHISYEIALVWLQQGLTAY